MPEKITGLNRFFEGLAADDRALMLMEDMLCILSSAPGEALQVCRSTRIKDDTQGRLSAGRVGK
jgi:hypothetical protein